MLPFGAGVCQIIGKYIPLDKESTIYFLLDVWAHVCGLHYAEEHSAWNLVFNIRTDNVPFLSITQTRAWAVPSSSVNTPEGSAHMRAMHKDWPYNVQQTY